MSTNASPQRHGGDAPSVGTIIWGGVVIAVAALIAAGRLGWLSVDPGLVAVVLLLVAGVGLVVGGILAATRGRRRDGA